MTPTRRVRYQVAMSLHGYIAGPKGEYDWIVQGPDGGIPLLPPPARQVSLTLTGHQIYRTGIALMEYAVSGSARATARA